MTPQFSPHAQWLFQDILLTIEEKLSYEDALRWHDKIISDVAHLEHFPLSCPNVPLECFNTMPPNPERLHQLIVKPYRIVYEVIGNEVHVLSIRHSRMLVAGTDTYWNYPPQRQRPHPPATLPARQICFYQYKFIGVTRHTSILPFINLR